MAVVSVYHSLWLVVPTSLHKQKSDKQILIKSLLANKNTPEYSEALWHTAKWITDPYS